MLPSRRHQINFTFYLLHLQSDLVKSCLQKTLFCVRKGEPGGLQSKQGRLLFEFYCRVAQCFKTLARNRKVADSMPAWAFCHVLSEKRYYAFFPAWLQAYYRNPLFLRYL